VREWASGVARTGLRGLASGLGQMPIQVLVRDLERQGVEIGRLRALEVFGSTGDRVTRHYAERVATLDVWEIDGRLEPALRRNLPRARIAIVDSFEEVRRTDRRYDLVVVDNPVWPVEHFPLFPHLFRLLSDDAVLVMDVIPSADAFTTRRYPELFDAEHLENRRAFYGTDHPEDIPLARLARHYGEMAAEEGYAVWWQRSVRRREIERGLPRPVTIHMLALGMWRR